MKKRLIVFVKILIPFYDVVYKGVEKKEDEIYAGFPHLKKKKI